jgi:hypothetical protein
MYFFSRFSLTRVAVLVLDVIVAIGDERWNKFQVSFSPTGRVLPGTQYSRTSTGRNRKMTSHQAHFMGGGRGWAQLHNWWMCIMFRHQRDHKRRWTNNKEFDDYQPLHDDGDDGDEVIVVCGWHHDRLLGLQQNSPYVTEFSNVGYWEPCPVFSLQLGRCLTNNTHLRKLDLGNLDLQEDSAQTLADGIRRSKLKVLLVPCDVTCLLVEHPRVWQILCYYGIQTSPTHQELTFSFDFPGTITPPSASCCWLGTILASLCRRLKPWPSHW